MTFKVSVREAKTTSGRVITIQFFLAHLIPSTDIGNRFERKL